MILITGGYTTSLLMGNCVTSSYKNSPNRRELDQLYEEHRIQKNVHVQKDSIDILAAMGLTDDPNTTLSFEAHLETVEHWES